MIKRERYLSQIRPFYDSELIKVITGIRRSGKSVLLMQIIDEIRAAQVDEQQIIYINFEDFDYSFISTASDLNEYVKKKIIKGKKNYLFFDEIQSVDEFEKVINSFRVKYDASIFITGSNGKLLSGELATILAGRYVSFRVFPFSFNEMLKIKEIEKENATDDMLVEYMTWGGLPQRFSLQGEEQTKVFLRDVFDAVVLRDIVQRAGIKDIDLFSRIIEYLVCNPSQIFSAKSISDYFLKDNRRVSKETIYNYLEHITSSLIMTRASRYDVRGKKILSKMDKFYLSDMGLGRIKNPGFKVEMGALLENVVFNELLARGYEVYVGKLRNREVDFVAVKGQEREYYQVAYYLYDEDVIDREFGAFREIKDNYPKYVISFDKMDFSRDGIIHKNAVKFLTE